MADEKTGGNGDRDQPEQLPSGDHAALAAAFPDDVTGYDVLADGQGITEVAPDGIFQAAAWVKDQGYRILSCLSAYDLKKPSELGVFYSFVKPASAPEEFGEICLRVRLPRPEEVPDDWMPEVQSIADVFPAADWQEREMYDLYGVRFDGHPDLRRIFLPEGWTGFPGRKDYKEAEQFVAMQDGEDIVLKEQEEGSW